MSFKKTQKMLFSTLREKLNKEVAVIKKKKQKKTLIEMCEPKNILSEIKTERRAVTSGQIRGGNW